MAGDFNQQIVEGRLVGPPEKKGNSCFFTVASNKGYGDKQKTSYFNCGASQKMAENMMEKIELYTKGRRVKVVGENLQSSYQDKSGNKRYSWTLWLDRFPQFLDYQKTNTQDKEAAGYDDVPQEY
jgi:single-stranded DNA-binding protein